MSQKRPKGSPLVSLRSDLCLLAALVVITVPIMVAVLTIWEGLQ